MKTNNLLRIFPVIMAMLMSGQSVEGPRFRGASINGYNPEFHPRRTKFKGWMRENRRSTFNKNR